jgi:hypothetical protein
LHRGGQCVLFLQKFSMKMLIIVPHRKLAFDGESFSKNEQISVKALSGNSDQETSEVNRADICIFIITL